MSKTEASVADGKVKIDLLLKEYDSLRSEILTRCNSRFAILGLIGGTLAYAGSQTKVPWYLQWTPEYGQILFAVSLLIVAFLLIAVVWWRLGQLINRCSMRIAEIEKKINQLAGQELLCWESRVARQGLFHKVYR